MQAITPELTAILKDHFQAGASGFRGRVEVDSIEPAAITCAESLAEAATATLDEQAHVAGAVSLSITAPASGGIIIGGIIASNGFSAGGTGDFTTLVSGNCDGGTGHPGVGVMWAAKSGATAMTGSYTGRRGSGRRRRSPSRRRRPRQSRRRTTPGCRRYAWVDPWR